MVDLILRYVLPTAYTLLPPAMASDRATALLLAIGLQETGFRRRRQVGGPARGFWQFEASAVLQVLGHVHTRDTAREAVTRLQYAAAAGEVLLALEHNDVLAAVCARLLLWSSLRALPGVDDAAAGWQLYLGVWAPAVKGRQPNDQARWTSNYDEAWARVAMAASPAPPSSPA